ncbi:BT_3928 family protein [Taibaiella chishuiensis]|nr:BT_3928 family protein [Taibaiella chishuiensis]
MTQINTSATAGRPATNRGAGFYLLQFIRVFVGVLFIFSGLIKANDPSGLAYKMEEFFEVWHMTFMSSYALVFSIVMIVFEIIAGVALLLGFAFRLFSFLLLLLMIFFTFLTAYAVFSGKIKECGCFGDCIPLTAMQSFTKDIILLVLVVILFAGRKHIRPLFRGTVNTILFSLSLIGSVLIQWVVLEHLPFVDCLPYKVGNNIWEKMQPPPGSTPDVYQTNYVLKNAVSGETKKISDKDYISSGIWKDTTWQLNGEPVTELIKKGNATPAIQDFKVSDYAGEDYTESLLKEPGYNFVFFLKDADNASSRNTERLRALIEKANKNNVGFFVLSANTQEQTERYLQKNKLVADHFVIDATVCKTAMRTNPGLMLIKAGTVLGKWSYNDYPKDFDLSGDKLKIKK